MDRQNATRLSPPDRGFGQLICPTFSGCFATPIARRCCRTDAHRHGGLMAQSQTVNNKSPISVGGVCLPTT